MKVVHDNNSLGCWILLGIIEGVELDIGRLVTLLHLMFATLGFYVCIK
jgi:hypothetical protein